MAGDAGIYKFQCVQCGADTIRKYRGSGTRPTLCSNACKIIGYRARHPKRAKASRQIELAKRKLVAKIKYCDCGNQIAKGRHKCGCCVFAKRLDSLSVNQCNSCGVVIGKGKQRCEPCREVARFLLRYTPSARASKRKARMSRKAKAKGLHAESFDPIEILNRDGWRCYICGRNTPKELRGTYAPNAPELDHVVALAAGGQHTRANTACCCRQCNGLKSDRPLKEMLKAA